jgi:hypothetical protein
MRIEKINMAQTPGLIDDVWSPRIVGALNGWRIKLTKANP